MVQLVKHLLEAVMPEIDIQNLCLKSCVWLLTALFFKKKKKKSCVGPEEMAPG